MVKWHLHVSENELPRNYNHKIVENNIFSIIIRCNLKNIVDINNWVTEFGELTHTKWNSRGSRPEGMRFICRKDFVCHRNQFNKMQRAKADNCDATLKVKIKLSNSNTRYTDPYVKEGLCAIVSIKKLHSHTLKTKEALKRLPASEALKAKFFMYFDNGMGVAESCNYHRKILELQGKSVLEMANPRICPAQRTVRHWHNKWKDFNDNRNYGIDLLQKLKEKQVAYADQGITMLFNEIPFSVAIVTPLMQRTHELQSSQNFAFIDSIEASYAENHFVTFVSTPCPAGVSPLGVIVTEDQSYESYQAGFKLLNTAVMNSFGGQGFPKVFITDSLQEKINAVKSVWPKSRNFYSVIHVCHTVWQWLSDDKNHIPKGEIPSLMLAFQRCLFSNTIKKATDAFQDLYQSAIPYPNFHKYVSHYWEFKELWCLAWQGGSVQEHRMNTSSELCMHIFKNIALSKVIMNKVIPVIDFCCTALDDFYCHKFQQFTNDKSSTYKIFFSSLLKQIPYLDPKDIVTSGEEFYVPSRIKSQVYSVIPSTALCTCLSVQNGKFCDHLSAVYTHFDVISEKCPPITAEDRYNIALLAMGNDVPLKSFYNLHSIEQSKEKISSPEKISDISENNIDESINHVSLKSYYVHTLVQNNKETSLPEKNSDSTENTSEKPVNKVPLKYFYNVHTLKLDEDDVSDAEEISSPEKISYGFENIADESMTSEEGTEETLVSENEYAGDINELLGMLKARHVKFGSSSMAVEKIMENLQDIKSAEQWKAFLHAFSSDISVLEDR